MTTVRIIGPGRAGTSFADALAAVGLSVELLYRQAPQATAAAGVDVVLVCTPDAAIATVAASIEPAHAAVLHCSGATGLAVLEPHKRRGSLHPLMALPDRERGRDRLRSNAWFAIAGDPITAKLVDALGGRHFVVDDHDRGLYHATAAVSANHLVALLAQIERLAAQVGVPVNAFFEMARASLDDVVDKGAAAALTGPAARGDHGTLAAHRASLPPGELALYDALATAAATLARPASDDL